MEKSFFKKAASSISKKWKELTGQKGEENEEQFVFEEDAPTPAPEPVTPKPEPTGFGEQLSIDLAAKAEEEPVTPTPKKVAPPPVEKEPDDDPKEETREEGPDACEKVIGFNEETGNYLVVHYRRGFEARLIQANPEIKRYYSDLKNALLTYEGTKSRLSWTSDNFHNGRRQVAKINVKSGLLVLYLAIDPKSLEGTVYRGRDVSDKKKYEDTPFEYKIRTPRKLKWGIELIEKTSDGMGLTKNAPDPVDYVKKYAFETTEELVNRGLIKETMTEESPSDLSPELLRRSGETFGTVEPDEPILPASDEPYDEPAEEAVIEPEPAVDLAPIEESVSEEPREGKPEEPVKEVKRRPLPEIEVERIDIEAEAAKTPDPSEQEKAPEFQEPDPSTMAQIDIDEVQGMYRPGEVVNLLSLKAKSLVDPRSATLRVVSSSGEALPKPLKVEAERFSLSAMQAICLGDGDVILLQWKKN